MIEYILLIVLIILLSELSILLGIYAAWLLVPLLLAFLPSLYAMLKGAPFVPGDPSSVKRMIELADLKPGDQVVDLGSGDGRILLAAMEKGAHAVGYELAFFLYIIARLRGCRVRLGNFWTADLSQVDVVFCYLLPKPMLRLEKEIFPQLKAGCRIIVNTFPLPNLKPTACSGNIYRYDR